MDRVKRSDEGEMENGKTIEQAQSQNIYNLFNELFSPISTEYHGL